jgi:indolepyruvate ferredoxin oxidoreductase beta subunit
LSTKVENAEGYKCNFKMKITSVLFSGVGGQGIILASAILAKCAFLRGLMVKESELHGMAQRGGSVISHVRFGSEVFSPLIPRASADFLVALEELEGLRNLHYLKPSAVVIMSAKQIVPLSADPMKNPYPDDVERRLLEEGFRVDVIDSMAIAKEIGNMKVENVIMVGALSSYLEFPMDVWEQAIAESVPSKTVQINVEAFRKGRGITSGKQACPNQQV